MRGGNGGEGEAKRRAFRCFGPAEASEASPVSRVWYLPRTLKGRREGTAGRPLVGGKGASLHTTPGLGPTHSPVFAYSSARCNCSRGKQTHVFRAPFCPHSHPRRIAILRCVQPNNASRSRDLLTTWRGAMSPCLMTTVLSRCSSQPVMRTPLSVIAAQCSDMSGTAVTARRSTSA